MNIARKLLLIALSTFSLAETSHGNFSITGCSMGRDDFTLNLTDVGLKIVPDGFVKNKYLTHLILDGNQISMISTDTLSSVPKLSYLSLANNKLTSLELRPFSRLLNLTTLILDGNCKSRTAVDYSFPRYMYNKRLNDAADNNSCSLRIDSDFPSLTHLFVQNNDLQKLSFISGQLPTLTHFYLSDNQLTLNDDTILSLKKVAPVLSHFYLKHSGIFSFDASLLPKVSSLYLDKNNIHSVCNEYCESSSLKLKEARNLETLSASYNQISKIDVDSFNHTTNLTSLDLSHNKLTDIREGTFDKLRLLRYLSLEYNNLVNIDAAHPFRGLINLGNLSLGHNNISELTGGAFEHLERLETLALSRNGIWNIVPGTFSNLTKLQELSLAGNQLSNIPRDCMPTSGSLVILNLDDNRITSVEDISISNVPHMLTLSLRDNPLTGMTSRWFSIVPPNLNIILGSSCYSNSQKLQAMA